MTDNEDAERLRESYPTAQDGEAPARQNRRSFLKTKIIGAGVAASAAAVAGGLAIPAVQRGLIYYTRKDFKGNPLPDMKEPGEYGISGVTSQTLTTASGDTFLTWRSEKFDADKPTLLFFAGNGGHLGYSPDIGLGGVELGHGHDAYIKQAMEAQKKGYQILFVQPVGFPGSNVESPTEQQMFESAEAAVDWLVKEQDVKPNNLHIAGLSMGTTLAAHAANHLSQQPEFLNDNNQHIHLLMVNGLIDVIAGIEAFGPPFLHHYADLVQHDRLDTGNELREMATSGEGRRIHVDFIRGKEDKATPEGQIEAHKEAAEGLDFKGRATSGKHYLTAPIIMAAIQDADKRASLSGTTR